MQFGTNLWTFLRILLPPTSESSCALPNIPEGSILGNQRRKNLSCHTVAFEFTRTAYGRWPWLCGSCASFALRTNITMISPNVSAF